MSYQGFGSYYTTPFPTKFPAIIPRHWYPPAASLRGFGDDPAPVDVSNWWTQAQQYAQQYMPGQTDPNAPVPVPPTPAPTPSTDPNAPQGTIVSDSASSTLLMTGAIALVGVIGVVFLLKETR